MADSTTKEVDTQEIDVVDPDNPDADPIAQPGDEVEPTDDLDSLEEVHAQAAQNRRALGPVADDPTIATPGTEFPPQPGPGPTAPDLALFNATAGALTVHGGAPEELVEAKRSGKTAAGAPTSTVEGYEGETADVEDVDQVDSDYEPGDYTVNEVNEYIADHPEEADAIYAKETSGKGRAGIIG